MPRPKPLRFPKPQLDFERLVNRSMKSLTGLDNRIRGARALHHSFERLSILTAQRGVLLQAIQFYEKNVGRLDAGQKRAIKQIMLRGDRNFFESGADDPMTRRTMAAKTAQHTARSLNPVFRDERKRVVFGKIYLELYGQFIENIPGER